MFFKVFISLSSIAVYANARSAKQDEVFDGSGHADSVHIPGVKSLLNGVATIATDESREKEYASVVVELDQNGETLDMGLGSVRGKAGPKGGHDGPSASFEGGRNGLDANVRLSEGTETKLEKMKKLDVGDDAVEEWLHKRVDDKFAPIYERLAEGAGESVRMYIESNTRSHMTINPNFNEFMLEEVPLKIEAILTGANLPALTSGKRVPVDFDESFYTREMAFLRACDNFIAKEELKMKPSESDIDTGFDPAKWKECLDENCDTRFGHIVTEVYNGDHVSRTPIKNYCRLPVGAGQNPSSYHGGRCQQPDVPCQCRDTNVVPPLENIHEIEWQHILKRDSDERMNFQICFSELSSLVYEQKQRGRVSYIQIKAPDAALSSPIPEDFKRLYAVEAKIATDAYVSAALRGDFLKDFPDLFHSDFYVQIEEVAYKYDRTDPITVQQDSSSEKSLFKKWLEEGTMGATTTEALNEILKAETKINNLMKGFDTKKEGMQRIWEKVTSSVRVDVAKILESLTAFLDSALAKEHPGFLSMAYFIATFHVEKTSLKYYIQQIKAHRRQWMRFEKLEQDLQSKVDVDASTRGTWIDECKIAAHLAMEKLETEMIAAFRLKHLKEGMAKAEASENKYKQGQHGFKGDTLDEEYDAFLINEVMGDVERTSKGRRCGSPENFSIFGFEEEFDRRSCCIDEAKEVILRNHRGNLDRDVSSLQGFVQKLSQVKATLISIATQRLSAALQEINEIISLVDESGEVSVDLIKRRFIDKSGVEVNQGSLAMDEVYVEAVLEAANPQLVYILLDSVLMASTRYKAQDVSIEIVGFFRDLQVQQCTIFIPSYFSSTVCENGQVRTIQSNGVSAPLDSHMRFGSAEWSLEQRFLDRGNNRDDENGASVSKMWLLYPASQEKIFTLDCDVAGSSSKERDEFIEEIEEWTKRTLPLSVDFMTLPDVEEKISCDTYCVNQISRLNLRDFEARCHASTNSEGVPEKQCQMRKTQNAADFSGHVSPAIPATPDELAVAAIPNQAESDVAASGDVAPGASTLESGVEKQWKNMEPKISCVPAEVKCREAKKSGSIAQDNMNYWRKHNPVRQMSYMMMAGQISTMSEAVGKGVKEASYRLAQRPILSAWISGLGGLTCEGISSWVGDWLQSSVDMPRRTYSLKLQISWPGADVRGMLKKIEDNAHLYGVLRLNILKDVEEVLRRHLISMTSDQNVVNDDKLAKLVSEVYMNGISLKACENDSLCLEIENINLTGLRFHADSVGLELDFSNVEHAHGLIKAGLCGKISSIPEFSHLPASGEDKCYFDIKLREEREEEREEDHGRTIFTEGAIHAVTETENQRVREGSGAGEISMSVVMLFCAILYARM